MPAHCVKSSLIKIVPFFLRGNSALLRCIIAFSWLIGAGPYLYPGNFVVAAHRQSSQRESNSGKNSSGLIHEIAGKIEGAKFKQRWVSVNSRLHSHGTQWGMIALSSFCGTRPWTTDVLIAKSDIFRPMHDREKVSHVERRFSLDENGVPDLQQGVPTGEVSVLLKKKRQAMTPRVDHFAEALYHGKGTAIQSRRGINANSISVVDRLNLTGRLNHEGNISLSGSEKHATINTADFAFWRWVIFSFTVSNDSYFLPVASHHNGGTEAGLAQNPNSQEQPLYMRIHMLGYSVGGDSWAERLVNDFSVDFSVSNRDIDVSHDKVKWLHLFGPSCVRRCPPFKGKKGANQPSSNKSL
jgi:hypothetical protein